MNWPHGYSSCFCLRVDVDTVSDARASSSLLSLLGKTEIKATFFVATGPDDAAREFPRAIVHTGRKRYLLRYGLEGLRELLWPLDVEGQLEIWREMISSGHEMALHGYWHRRWVRSASGWGQEETRRAVEEGTRRFVRAFAIKPKGFAAPGFRTNEGLQRILEEMEFEYSSNTRGVFDPEIVSGRVLEIPVVNSSMGELMLAGSTEGEASSIVHQIADKAHAEGSLCCYYIHPAFEAKYCRSSFRSLLLRQAAGGAWTPTLAEAVDWLRKNGDA